MKRFKASLLSIILMTAMAGNLMYSVDAHHVDVRSSSNNTALEIFGSTAAGIVLGSIIIAAYIMVSNYFQPPEPDPQDEPKEKVREKQLKDMRARRLAEDQRLRNMGIENNLIPFVKNAEKVGNKLFIQLKTVDQSSSAVVQPVREFYNRLNRELKKRREEQGISFLQEDYDLFRNFAPGATCFAHSEENAGAMIEFLLRGDQNDVSTLVRINSNIHAKENLRARVDNQNENGEGDPIPTSWGETGDINRYLREHNLDTYASTVSSVSVFNEHIEKEEQRPFYQEMQKITQRVENPFHVFIVEANDSFHQVYPVINELKQKENIILERHDVTNILQAESGKTHFYVAAIQRIGAPGAQAQFRYYILDTLYDHFRYQSFKDRDRFFADHMIEGRSSIDFKKLMQDNVRKSIKGRIKSKELAKKLAKEEEKRKKREELLQKRKKENEKKIIDKAIVQKGKKKRKNVPPRRKKKIRKKGVKKNPKK